MKAWRRRRGPAILPTVPARVRIGVVAAAVLAGTVVTYGVGPEPKPPLALVPWPSSVTAGRGTFTLKATTPIVTDAASRRLGRQLAGMLGPATAFDLPVRVGSSASVPHISLAQQPSLLKTLGPEGYRLTVTPRAVVIRAARAAGVFYGMQTLRQLLPAAIYRARPPAAPSGRYRR